MGTERLAQTEQKKTHATFYFWGVFVLGMGLWISTLFLTPQFWQVNHLDVFLFLLLNIMAEQTFIMLPQGGGISASFAIILASLLLFNAPVAIFIAVCGALVTMGAIQQRPTRIVWFNAAQYALTYSIAGLCVYGLLAVFPFAGHSADFTRHMVVGGVATLIYLLINIPLVNGFMRVREGNVQSFRVFVKSLVHVKEDLTEILQTLFFYPIAVLVAYSYGQQHNPMIPLVLTLLVFGSLRFIEQRRHLEKQREKMQALYHMTRKMTESAVQKEDIELEPSHVFNSLFDDSEVALRNLVRLSRASIYRVEWQGENKGRIVHQRSEPHRDVDSIYDLEQAGLLQDIAKTGKSAFIQDMSTLGKSYDTWRITYQCLLGEPIKINDRVMFLLIMFRKTGRPFQEEDRRLIKLLVNAFENTLKNIELRNRLQAQAIKDGLMNIYNHRYLKGKLEEEVARATRYRKPLSLIITDVDYFKKFNDTHGHLLGDQVLKEMALILSDSVRETDIVARYGGEELAILLPETPLDAASDVAERIRKRVAEHTFYGKNNEVVPMSLSIGVSCLFEEPSLTAAELIVRTDTALYRAKHQGRNQICQASMTANGLIIQTHAKGAPPQPADQSPQSDLSLSGDLQKSWQDHHEKSLPEIQRILRHEIQQAQVSRSMMRYFEKQWLPEVPELLSALVNSALTHEKALHPRSPLAQLIKRIESAIPRKLPRTEHLSLLQHLLLKVYRHFLRQALELPVSDSDKKRLFNHGFRLIMILQNHLFNSSLHILAAQQQQAEQHYRFAQTLLNSMPGGTRLPAERLKALCLSFPDLLQAMLYSPRPETAGYQRVAVFPAEAEAPAGLTLKTHHLLTPHIRPVVIQTEVEDLNDYLQPENVLPTGLAQDTHWVLVPLWHQAQSHGLLVLVFEALHELSSQRQQTLLKLSQDWVNLLHIESSLSLEKIIDT